MPLERSNAIPDLSDPNIVLGPRKRRPTERILENGDPLTYKKAKKDNVIISHACVDKGNCTSSLMPLPTHLTHTVPHAMGAADNAEHNNDRSSTGALGNKVIMVEDSDGEEDDWGSDKEATTDEDDDAELGTCSIAVVCIC